MFTTFLSAIDTFVLAAKDVTGMDGLQKVRQNRAP